MRDALLDEVVRRIGALRQPHPLRVGINGVDAAGKTTFADELAGRIGARAIRASVDDFARPRAQRYARGRLSPEGYYRDSTDCEALIGRLLVPLGPGGSRRYTTRVFDVWNDRPLGEPERVAPEDAVLLLDGIFLLRPELRVHLDWTLFLHVDFETALARALAREQGRVGADEAETRRIYARRYLPAQSLYFDEVRPRECADLVVDNGRIEAPFILE